MTSGVDLVRVRMQDASIPTRWPSHPMGTMKAGQFQATML